MKKLLILVLVFGFASVSLAGLVPLTNTNQLTAVVSGGVLTIGGISAPTVANDQWGLGIDYGGAIAYAAPKALLAAAGDLGGGPFIAGNGFDINIGGSIVLATAGNWVTLQAPLLAVGTLLDVWDYAVDPTGNTKAAGNTVTVTPEPMTIALLGLGGLLLRRRMA